MKKHIPNIITSLNLLCGCLAVIAALDQHLVLAAILVITGAIFDFFDGFAARLLKVSSPIGKELDSLADMVTFGLVPGLIVLRYLANNHGVDGFEVSSFLEHPILFIAFMIPIFSALRLAKFNVDERQQYGFRGVPTPASALWFISIPLILNYMPYHLGWSGESAFVSNGYLIGSTVIISLLMVSDIPLLAMKFTSYDWKSNQPKYIFLISSVLLLIILQVLAIPAILSLYLVISIVSNLINKNKNEVQS
ncbi:MAG: CDP-diacylglycerol--serine O-phosphatidyltransferase [Granulosicoccus sp.]|jgi:CDP-diacylglycerol--serine O-phosphatidyltransferase